MKDGVRSLKDCLLRFNGVLDNEATLLTCGFCFAFLRYDLSMEHGGGDFALRQFGMVRAKDHPLLIKAILNRLNALEQLWALRGAMLLCQGLGRRK